MKCMSVGFLVALAAVFGQTAVWGQTTSRGLRVVEVQEAVSLHPTVQGNAPVQGDVYTISQGFAVEQPINGFSQFFAGTRPDPSTNAINPATMDGVPDVIGIDYADVFGAPAANPVVAFECLESLGLDPGGSGRFLLRLTVGVESTASALQWDSLTVDNQDPLDADGDGETGKGQDGVYFTADDVVATDGLFDTGDGSLDAPFPLDPTGLVFLLDIDNDDTTTDPPSAVVGNGLILGLSDGVNDGIRIQFDPAAGPVTVQSANWELRDINGNLADVDGDGIGEPPIDVSVFSFFTAGPGGGWNGSVGLVMLADGNVCSTTENVNGNVRTNQLVVEYLSDIEPDLFCPEGEACAAPSGFNLFRGVPVGTPDFGDFAGPDGTVASFIPAFTIGNFEAPVWLIFDYDAAASGAVEVTSTAGTPGLEMTVEYSTDGGASYTVIDTAVETFNSPTTEVFDLGGVSADVVRVGWRRVGFTINFPWRVDVDAVSLCQ